MVVKRICYVGGKLEMPSLAEQAELLGDGYDPAIHSRTLERVDSRITKAADIRRRALGTPCAQEIGQSINRTPTRALEGRGVIIRFIRRIGRSGTTIEVA